MPGKSPACSDRIRIDKLTSRAAGPKSSKRVSKTVPPEQSVINCHSERSRRIYVRLAVTLCPPTPTILRHCSGLQGALRVTVGLTLRSQLDGSWGFKALRVPRITSDHFRRTDGSCLVDAGVAFTPCPELCRKLSFRSASNHQKGQFRPWPASS